MNKQIYEKSIILTGPVGSCKSLISSALAEELNMPKVELDKLRHLPSEKMILEFLNQETDPKKIEELNEDRTITAILVQLPLPEHIDKNKVINSISPKKDVDGFTPYNFGRLFAGEEPYVYPCTPRGIIRLLDEYKIPIEGKHAVIVGRSNIVGKPLSQMLLNRNATVTICHSKTKNLAEITKTADILISAVGGKIIGKNMLKSGCVVIDVGIFKDENGKTRGDIDFENSFSVASYISPVPGGVGPMTIAMLMSNTVELFEKFGNN